MYEHHAHVDVPDRCLHNKDNPMLLHQLKLASTYKTEPLPPKKEPLLLVTCCYVCVARQMWTCHQQERPLPQPPYQPD